VPDVADDSGAVDRSEWLLAPPGAGEVRLVVELGEGAALTPEAQASLEDLMRQLNQSEVEGFAFNRGINVGLFGSIGLTGSTCEKLVCSGNSCDPLTCDQYKASFI
jgi:hypothetical protein